jgi:hypothetical protein
MATYQPGPNFPRGNETSLVLEDAAHTVEFTKPWPNDDNPYTFTTTDAAVIAWLDAMPAGTVTKTAG